MMKKTIQKVKVCRICGSSKLYPFLSLGKMPIPNGFIQKEELNMAERYYPLAVCVCENCWLVQLTHIVSPEIMFRNYVYIPSTSVTMVDHFRSMANAIVDKYKLNGSDLVVDVGSNDGTLLSFFKGKEIKVLGVDPSENLSAISNLKGIETMNNFFGIEVAEKIRKEKGKAKVVTATNVLAHIHDLDDICKGVNILLENEGLFIVEFPYFLDLIDKNEFDSIYHEHLSYFSLKPLCYLFQKYNLHIIDIKKVPVHGGSLRIFVSNVKSRYKPSLRVKDFLERESLRKLNRRSTYNEFARRVKAIRRDLVSLLKRLKLQGKRIVGYGAAAKGNVLLNYCKLDSHTIEYIVDSIPYKQGKFTPGTHIPIYPETRLENDTPDYVLLLAWNFADEILRKQVKYRERDGEFIITIPYLRIE
ncbi:MAG: class I SAM-dependent methyltransferase [bacterium]|nr:class I SAM-dependent methyltransferase [bacterium]